jgi:hypothetical protein
MRMRGGVLIIALVGPSLVGCGTGNPGATPDRSGLAGWVHLGPQCPVETEGDPCEDKPATGSKVTVATPLPGNPDAAGEVVAHTTTDADGNYRVAVPPGMYVVTAQAGMSCRLMNVRVTHSAYLKVDIACDTGIR